MIIFLTLFQLLSDLPTSLPNQLYACSRSFPAQKPTKHKYENQKLRKQNEKIVHIEKTMEFILCLLALPAWSLPECGCVPATLHYGELVSPLPAGINYKQLLGCGWVLCLLLSLSVGSHLAKIIQGWFCCHSLCEFLRASFLLCGEETVSLKSSITSDS